MQVQGLVVEVARPDPDLHPHRPLSLSLDDGTGVLRVAVFGHTKLAHLTGLELGWSVQVRGALATFRDQLQLRAAVVKVDSASCFMFLEGGRRPKPGDCLDQQGHL